MAAAKAAVTAQEMGLAPNDPGAQARAVLVLKKQREATQLRERHPLLLRPGSARPHRDARVLYLDGNGIGSRGVTTGPQTIKLLPDVVVAYTKLIFG